MIKTKLLSYSCFFLFLVEVEREEDVEDIGAEDNNNEKGKKEEEKRPCFSLSA